MNIKETDVSGMAMGQVDAWFSSEILVRVGTLARVHDLLHDLRLQRAGAEPDYNLDQEIEAAFHLLKTTLFAALPDEHRT